MEALLFSLCVLLLAVSSEGYKLSAKTCFSNKDPLTFTAYELNCQYRGPGLYIFDWVKTIKILSMDSLPTEGHLRVKEPTSLEEITILDGACSHVTVPNTVKVTVDGEICVSRNTENN